MNAKTITAWAGAVIAAGGAFAVVMGPVQSNVRELIAQEANAAAKMAIEEEVRPIASTFEKYLQLQRRSDDREERDICLDERVEFPDGERRARRCAAESDYRWLRWAFDDCRDMKGEDDPSCIEPEAPPRVESQRR